ncbi:MAG: hypothetical protein ACHQ1D_01565 [Nitrososphaerales archaeon]
MFDEFAEYEIWSNVNCTNYRIKDKYYQATDYSLYEIQVKNNGIFDGLKPYSKILDNVSREEIIAKLRTLSGKPKRYKRFM